MTKHRDNTIDMFAPVVKPLEEYRRETMEAAKGEGTACPCCNQFVRIYRRTITSTMARMLITGYHKYGVGKWFHVRELLGQNDSGPGDFPKLESWGLIERKAHVQGEDGKRASGMWRITQKGSDFIHNKCEVPMYVLIYNAVTLGFEGENLRIHHALGKKYDYREIMGWTGTGVSAL